MTLLGENMNPRFIFVAIFLIVLNGINYNSYAQVNATAPTGTGSESNPYQIRTLSHLLWVSLNPNKWDSYFIQTANIDASNTQYWDDINDNSPLDNDPYDDPNDGTTAGNNEGFPPIGRTGEVNFTGFYDGQGYTIIGLTINRGSSDEIGLFGEVSDALNRGVFIRNLHLTDVDIIGGANVGAIVGSFFSAEISSSHSSGVVSGNSSVGGLIGISENSTVSNSYSFCSATGNGSSSSVGGLVGYNSNSTIANCYSTGAVTGSNSSVGGLTG